MPSLIQGYEYDIFISYRHNDNLDGWVTDFVQNLEKELRSTLKDTLTIYFDKNPYDGLLETHNVDKSLEGKLKCLIFIPIISQTYCDAKSFAWQHEFVAFNKLAKEDQFGRDIKLSNGNVASRILPIKIHDLDAEDKSIIENEIGGVLRAIEFIFKSSGVNRPLTSSDKREENANKTLYRDQVNKVANAIKEIITALKNPIAQSSRTTNSEEPATNLKQNRKTLIASLVLLCVVAISYFFYQERSTANEQPTLDKSIAVLPFVDMSPAHDQEYFGDGVAEEIINVLAQSEGLKVISRSSSFQFKSKNEDLKKVGELLGVATILEGSIRKSSDKIRVTAQLIKVVDGSHVWSKTFDRTATDMFAVQDEIAAEVAKALQTTLALNVTSKRSEQWNDEAYKLYLQARYFQDRDIADPRALELLEKSLALDSNQAIVHVYITVAKAVPLDRLDSTIANKHLKRAFLLDPNLAEAYAIKGFWYAKNYEFKKADKQLKIALRLNKNSPMVLRNVGSIYSLFGRMKESIELCSRAVEIDPLIVNSLSRLGDVYYRDREFKESVIYYRKSLELKSDHWIQSQAALALLFDGKIGEAIEENKKVKNDTVQLFTKALIDLNSNQKKSASEALQLFKEKASDKFPLQLGILQGWSGDKDEAFRWLNIAFDQKDYDLSWILTDPLYDPLRGDHRFTELVKKMNFPDK